MLCLVAITDVVNNDHDTNNEVVNFILTDMLSDSL